MSHETINSPARLADLCRRLAGADRIGIDTEFVSEDTYRPELCLIQVATRTELAVIDPYRAGDLSAFWQTLVEGDHVTIAHAAREELNFALAACDAPLANLFDTQLAAGFCSAEYPSSYGSVVAKFLNARPEKGEQRTDWRRRPLSDEQIDYALEDVRYLLPLYDALKSNLDRLERLDWLQEEMNRWLQEVRDAREQPRWRRVSGLGNLPTRSLAIVRELWLWRREQAERRDIPPRRVLRDDLIVELAKRKSDNVERIRAVRGMHRGLKRQTLEELAACVRRGLAAPLDDIERRLPEAMPSQLNLLGQFLSPALSSICRSANVATSLAGTAADVRDLIAYRLQFRNTDLEELPLLATGWRAELVGHLIEDLLAGKKSIRIEDPLSEHPLAFDPVGGFRDRYRIIPGEGKRRVRRWRPGPAVDSSYTMSDGQEFRDVRDFKRILLEHPEQLARGLAEQLMIYGTGAGITFADRPAIDAIVAGSRAKNFGVRSLVHAVVASPVFLSK